MNETGILAPINFVIILFLLMFGIVSTYLEFRETRTMECHELKNRDQLRATWDKQCKLRDAYKSDFCLDMLTCAWRRM